DAHEIDLRLGDPARPADQLGVLASRRDLLRHQRDIRGDIWIMHHRHVEAVLAGILRRTCLAGGGGRAGAGGLAEAVGAQLALAGFGADPCADPRAGAAAFPVLLTHPPSLPWRGRPSPVRGGAFPGPPEPPCPAPLPPAAA